ncbi:acyl-CoA thioesterase [Psychroserpens ponticola]|uniref:Acyl-CoA thioesterase n=1 Tax=Psychroserpens ponticola TaxID=2932268 RepID=A0ABY7RUN8_9FLAO|nr:acyl-CoA thioesterase [Psychroserpens ponticola]WCO00482.1 acyl-CoA thioesterase [Psychroserpens ponticola]
MKLSKTVSSLATIRFQDCDPFNHLNNASYINYFMNHREDQLIKAYDIDIYEMARKTGISWVSSSNQIAYIKPAFLMEKITIESQLIAFNNSNLKVEMRMYNSDKTNLKAIIWCGFTHFNLLKQQKEAHAEEFMSLFKSILNPIEELQFEKRVTRLKFGENAMT